MDNESKTKDGPAPTLATAQDVALAKNPIDTSPATTAVIKSLAAEKPIDVKRVDITAATIEAFSFLAGPSLVSDAELTTLRATQSKMADLASKMASYGPAAVNVEVQRQRESLYAKAQAGESVDDSTLDSREHIVINFR